MTHGPLCSCGCYREEHRTEVDENFHLRHAECLTCSQCERFDGDDTAGDAEREG